MIPDRRRPRNRSIVAAVVLRQLDRHRAALPPEAMTLETSLANQEGLPLNEVGGGISRAVRLEVGHEVGHLLGVQAWPLEPLLAEQGGHRRRVVPEASRQLERALGPPHQVERRADSLLPARHVALGAPLLLANG